MKEIKDYLHLYLGCEMYNKGLADNLYAKGIPYKPQKLKNVGSDGLFWVGSEEDSREISTTHLKPILRPLSDMTEDELQECGNLVYDFSDDKSGLGLNDHRFEDFQTLLCAEQFHWLIKRHFDLFDLIKDGLAIDKTKLTTNER